MVHEQLSEWVRYFCAWERYRDARSFPRSGVDIYLFKKPDSIRYPSASSVQCRFARGSRGNLEGGVFVFPHAVTCRAKLRRQESARECANTPGLAFAEALEELRGAAKISEEEGDTPTLSYIQDLIEQLNRALREVTFRVDRCSKGAPRRLSPREELGRSGGNEAITTSGIKRTACSRDGAFAPSLYSDYAEDETPDRRETGISVEFVGDLLRIKNSLHYCSRRFHFRFQRAEVISLPPLLFIFILFSPYERIWNYMRGSVLFRRYNVYQK